MTQWELSPVSLQRTPAQEGAFSKISIACALYPNEIRGYGPVKHESVKGAEGRVKALLRGRHDPHREGWKIYYGDVRVDHVGRRACRSRHADR